MDPTWMLVIVTLVLGVASLIVTVIFGVAALIKSNGKD